MSLLLALGTYANDEMGTCDSGAVVRFRRLVEDVPVRKGGFVSLHIAAEAAIAFLCLPCLHVVCESLAWLCFRQLGWFWEPEGLLDVSAPRPCRTGQLAITLGQTSAGLGHEGIAIVFRSRAADMHDPRIPDGDRRHLTRTRRSVEQKRIRSGYLAGAVPVSTVTVSIGHPASAFAEGLDPALCTGRNRRGYDVQRPVCRPSSKRARSSAPPSRDRRLPLVVLLLSIHPVTSGVTGLAPLPERLGRKRIPAFATARSSL